MNPKDKAMELAIAFCSPTDVFKPNMESVRCALIAVGEIIKVVSLYHDKFEDKYIYWQEVKQELETMD